MLEVELFVHFAEIAGVFVGFGALISLRSAHPNDVHDVVYLRAVLGLGVWVVIDALVPIAISRYGVHDRVLWLSAALAAVAIWLVFLIAFTRQAESRALKKSPERLDRLFPVVGLPLHFVIGVSLSCIVLGLWPELDEALYVTALTAGLVFAGYTLLAFVMSHTPGAGADPDSR